MRNRFERMFVPGGLKIPASIPMARKFSAALNFEAPKELILSAYNTAVENQGSKPWCAAYSAAGFAENLLWRKRGYQTQIDPAPLYAYAKSIDGDPDGDGTYLECTLKALLKYGHFDSTISKIRTFGGRAFGNDDPMQDYRFAIHKYGVCMLGLDIDTSWYSPKRGVIEGGGSSLGGHAVLGVGYDPDGVLLMNSWSEAWGHDGFAYVPNRVFAKQFMYGALLTRALDGLN